MKNKFLLNVLRCAVLITVMVGVAVAHGGEEDELSGFALFEKLREMKLEVQAALVKEDYVEAAKIYRRMARYEKNRARSAAYLLRGANCLMQAKKGHRALEEYTNLLENYSLYVPYEHVVEQLRQLAEWFIVGDGTFLGIRDKATGIQIYELIIREAPAVQVTLKDRLRLAELLEESGRGEEATVVYQALLRQEPNNWEVRTKLAFLFLKLSKSGDGDGAKLRAAVREANLVLQSDPNNPRAKELKKLCRDAEVEEAERLLKNGEFYLLPAHRRPSAARRYMYDLINKYPDSSAAKKARNLLKTNPDLRALEEENARAAVVPPPPKTTSSPSPVVVSRPVKPGTDSKAVERENAKKEAERLKREKELKARQAALEAEKTRKLKEQQEKERLEAEKRKEKWRKAEEEERRKAAEKAAKLKAKREAEEARERERLEKEHQKRLEEERKERQKQEQKLRREAEKAAKMRIGKEDAERARIEQARQKAEEKLLENERPTKPEQITVIVQDKKKLEESRRAMEAEQKRLRERNAKMLQNDPKLLEEEQKRLKELMEKNRRR